MSGGGTKLARSRPCSNNSAIHAASATSVLRPGTLCMCAAFTSNNSKSASNAAKTGFQYTPVASSATCVTPASVSQPANTLSPAVVVENCRVVDALERPDGRGARTFAITVSRCTSRPATRSNSNSIPTPQRSSQLPWMLPPAGDPDLEESEIRAQSNTHHYLTDPTVMLF